MMLKQQALAFIILSALPCFCLAQNAPIAISHVTVYTDPYAEPLRNATILIRDGKFKLITTGQPVEKTPGMLEIDGTGKFATAGFWNSHVHFIEPAWNNADVQPAEQLESKLSSMLLSRGFVYAFDLAQLDFRNLTSLRKRIATGEVKGPTIFATGVPFTAKSPFYIKPLVLPELATKDAVQKHLSTQLQSQADGIKLWSASPTGPGIAYLTPELIREAANITRRHRKPLFAHPTNLQGVKLAVDNGVNVLAHVAADDRIIWDAALVNKMVKQKIALIPTLQLHRWDLIQAGIQPDTHSLTRTAIGQTRAFQQAGGIVLFGTDVGYMTDYDPTDEYIMMKDAGMDFRQILASLTTNPAQHFSRARQTGKVKQGLTADLVLLADDPAKDVRNFSSVTLVIHKGVVVYRK